jgi:hypothetical protein
MKVIFSYWKTDEHFFITEDFALISNELAKKHGYETVLFTDDFGIEELKNIKYDKVVKFDQNLLNRLPKTGWSLAKILAMSSMQEPFMHVDFDLFLIKNLRQDFLENQVFCFHKEKWLTEPQGEKDKNGKFIENSIINPYSFEFLDKVRILLNETEDNFSIKNYHKLTSYNCAIVGGQNYKVFKKASEYVIKYALKYKDILENFPIIHRMEVDWFPAVFLEQVLYMNLIKLHSGINEIPFYLKAETTEDLNIEAQKEKIIHIWGSKLKFQHNMEKFIEFLKKENML